jgi:FkbM family methyltransferase
MLKSFLIHAFLRIRSISWFRGFVREVLKWPLISGLVRHVGNRILRLPTERIWVRIPEGWLKVDPYREQGYMHGIAEADLYQIIPTYKTAGCTFFDIGAHIGYYTLIGARIVGESGRVIAFEPDPENVALIREMVDKNGLTQVHIIPKAVWSRSGTVEFRRSTAGRMSGKVIAEGVPEGTGIASDETIFCSAVCLDDFCASREIIPCLVKIDVEGGELEVLRGASHLLAQHKPTLIVEIHFSEHIGQLYELLLPLGYIILPTSRKSRGIELPAHYIGHAKQPCGCAY